MHGGRELPLIPRCFDLLLLLIERRDEAVSRNDILDSVWSDVVVSDGALSQAVRTLRRALGDDPRDPTFIRTVSRHGYRFVCEDVVEEPDVGPLEPARATTKEPDANASFDKALEALLDAETDNGEGGDDRRRQAAETLVVSHINSWNRPVFGPDYPVSYWVGKRNSPGKMNASVPWHARRKSRRMEHLPANAARSTR